MKNKIALIFASIGLTLCVLGLIFSSIGFILAIKENNLKIMNIFSIILPLFGISICVYTIIKSIKK